MLLNPKHFYFIVWSILGLHQIYMQQKGNQCIIGHICKALTIGSSKLKMNGQD
jgi:TM2 domain-containing membrane protein YozV